MKKFIRDNFVLVIGATLPIIVILFFGLATLIPRYFVEPPKYDFLFYTGYYNDQNGFLFSVINGKLQIQYRCTNYACSNPSQSQKLYRFVVKSQTLKEIPLTLPSIPRDTKSFSVFVKVPETAHLQLDPSNKSPDGYQFNVVNTDSGNIFSLLLFSDYRNQLVISKNGLNIDIPMNPNNYSYYNSKLIGWIINEGAQ